MKTEVTTLGPSQFEVERHFYPKVINAQIHSMVRFFFSMDPQRIVRRYVHLNPRVSAEDLTALLASKPRYFRWAGADLMHVTTARGERKMVVIETNSCPSGQKSMPLYEEHDELGGYRVLLERTFVPELQSRRLPKGDLAVIFDKNPMEASGYAAALAEITQESVHLVPFHAAGPDAYFDDGILNVKTTKGLVPIRAAFRYVTQRPWNRIPVETKTAILNPVISCLAGGRNKAVAAKAYDFFNAEIYESGLAIHTPQTFWDVNLAEIPLWVRRLGGFAVVKVPYSNAGQGVYTITNEGELDAFMQLEHPYQRFIVQSLIGNHAWSSGVAEEERLYHVGTMPNRHGKTYAADLRIMVSGAADGYRPLAIYARRASTALTDEPPEGLESWDMLGTNLSEKHDDGSWSSDTKRLLIMDRRDFNNLGLGLDDLIEAYVQTVLASVAIDRMAVSLIGTRGKLKRRFFKSLNDDDKLLAEVI